MPSRRLNGQLAEPHPHPDGARLGEAAWLSPAAPRTASPGTSSASGGPRYLRQLGAIARSGPYIAQAPFAVVVCTEDTPFAPPRRASRAIQSMVMTAWSEPALSARGHGGRTRRGIGSNWVGFGGLEGAKPILGVPDNLDVLAIVPFGYPARPVGKGKKQRKLFAQVVSRNRFGRPFE